MQPAFLAGGGRNTSIQSARSGPSSSALTRVAASWLPWRTGRGGADQYRTGIDVDTTEPPSVPPGRLSSPRCSLAMHRRPPSSRRPVPAISEAVKSPDQQPQQHVRSTPDRVRFVAARDRCCEPMTDDPPPIAANGNCANMCRGRGYLDPIGPQSAWLDIEPPEKRFRCLVGHVCKDAF